MRLGWLTDIHYNFVPSRRRTEFHAYLGGQSLDALLVGGDIGESASVVPFLEEMADSLLIPIYFVLGNHDFYRGSIRGVRDAVQRAAGLSEWLHWMPTTGVVPLTAKTALIGHDGWADARLGNFFESDILLNDYLMIEELRCPVKLDLYQKLNALGDEAAVYLERQVRAALQTHQQIILLTHVPPYREACWHAGRISDNNWLPHFSCQAVGQRLSLVMREHPEATLTVYCGHTHGGGTARILDNLTVYTGEAEYGATKLQRVIVAV